MIRQLARISAAACVFDAEPSSAHSIKVIECISFSGAGCAPLARCGRNWQNAGSCISGRSIAFCDRKFDRYSDGSEWGVFYFGRGLRNEVAALMFLNRDVFPAVWRGDVSLYRDLCVDLDESLNFRGIRRLFLSSLQPQGVCLSIKVY